MKPSKVTRAYFRMLELIEDGAEFPEAQFTVSQEFALSDSQVAAVVKKYDTEPSGRAADSVS